MNRRELEVVEALRDVVWPTLQETFEVQMHGSLYAVEFGRECCVAGSRIAKEILEEHYLKAVAMKARVLIYTTEAWEWELAGRPEDAMPDPRRNVIKGCGLTTAENTAAGWMNGHAVLLVEDEILLDTTCQQFAQPERGLPFVEPTTVDLTDSIGQAWLADRTQGLAAEIEYGTLLYTEHPDLSLLYDAPDWQKVDDHRVAAKDRIRAKVNERLALLDV